MRDDVVRIGCWSAFWGDTPRTVEQLLGVSSLDYLVSDYLAEVTMALLARVRERDADAGWVPDAVKSLHSWLPDIAERGIRVVTNAGGLNPIACARAFERVVEEAGLGLRVAAVVGDDRGSQVEEILAESPQDMFTGVSIPTDVSSLNAYLGARPIAQALDQGADIVITGRCNDAAVVLGPLLHEFGWSDSNYDLLSAGSLVGHLLECGPQVTGGLHTDWHAVPGWDDIGYPIAECRPDGTAIITKPPGTGGLVSPASVGEQLLYEIGDPGAYILPDVVCDWRDVHLELEGSDRVLVSGARGSPPTDTYKVTATHVDGYRALSTAMFAGVDAAGRARRAGESLVARVQRVLADESYAPLSETSIEVIGAGDTQGPARRDDSAVEAVLKVGLRHSQREGLEIFASEFTSIALVAQGMTGVFAGRPRIAPVFSVYHLLVEKSMVPITVFMDGEGRSVPIAEGNSAALVATAPLLEQDCQSAHDGLSVPLWRLAYCRSGDKGNDANIGVIARRPEFLPILREQVTASRVAALFDHYLEGGVIRWELPGIDAINLVLKEVLGGRGGTSTLRYDPQGKSYGAMLLALRVTVPSEWEREGRLAKAST